MDNTHWTNAEEHLERLKQDLDVRAELSLYGLAASLSSSIRVGRENKKLSQAELAALLKTKQAQVSRLEDPLYTRYSLLTLAKIADVLGLDLSVRLSPRLQRAAVVSPSSEKVTVEKFVIPAVSANESLIVTSSQRVAA